MSGIYIPGMAMPAEQTYVLIIAIQSDGRVFPVRIDAEGNPMIFQNEEMQNRAIPVPPHGRLIDADSKTFPTLHRNPSNDYMKGWNACLRSVQQQPTIIPVEEGEG